MPLCRPLTLFRRRSMPPDRLLTLFYRPLMPPHHPLIYNRRLLTHPSHFNIFSQSSNAGADPGFGKGEGAGGSGARPQDFFGQFKGLFKEIGAKRGGRAPPPSGSTPVMHLHGALTPFLLYLKTFSSPFNTSS